MRPSSLHERIRAEIEARILSGALGPGDRIPSEIELMAHYGCSRMTVNKALSALNTAGLLTRRKRAGTVVAQRRTESMVLDIPDLPIEIAARGQAYRYRMIERSVECSETDRPDMRGFAGAGRVLFIRGVHFADQTPFAFEERWVNLAAVPAIECEAFADEPPGSWLLRHIPWTEAENRIDAIGADAVCSAHLGIAKGAACLLVERRTWRASEQITLVRQSFIGGVHGLTARFGANAPQPTKPASRPDRHTGVEALATPTL